MLLGEGFAVKAVRGRKSGNDLGNDDGLVLYIDSNGVTSSHSIFGGTSNDQFYDAALTLDGGLVLVGCTYSDLPGVTENGLTDVWVVKLTNTGAFQWQDALGGSSDDYGRSVAVAADGSIYIYGESTSSLPGYTNQGYMDQYMARVSSTGWIMWERLDGGDSDELGHAICPMSGGGIMAAGASISSNFGQAEFGGMDFMIRKLDDDGEL